MAPGYSTKDLVVIVDYDGVKILDEIEFVSIPILVCVMKMPLGLVTKQARDVISGMIEEEVLEVDADENDQAVGECMRIKIKLDIREPLMRGVTLDVGKEDEKRL
ncbi:unnamed protein product [Miscanthus lutarioriparius]|uniref:Uncharacterized protein n=1 Tax=Miscanthus lutarioriparius TaxID=422564 RepID=A0A811SE23_9POAL|nr:unnamed protein product [Miscanthus lutarioriparius]